MRTIRIGGFFSGIGAHHSAVNRIAAQRPDLDFKVIFQCEIDDKTATAYDLIHGEIHNLKDVTQVNDIGGDLAVDILYWTPPCQDISLANNNRQGNKAGSGTRSSLAFEVPRILANTPEEERPRYLVFEEVPMMISKDYIKNFKEIIRVLSTLGYTSNYGIMNSCDYGVAQNRKRCFMVSKLNGPAPKLPKPIPLDKCLKDYLEPEPVDKSYYLSSERVQGMIWQSERERKRYRQNHNHQGRRKKNRQLSKDMSVQIIAILNKDVYKDHEKNRRIYSIDGLCPTIITSNGGGHIPKIMVVKNEIEQRNE